MKILYKIVHSFYAYTVACALGLLVNGAFLLLAYSIFTSDSSKEILKSYGANNGIYVFVVTLILGAIFYPFTSKLNIVERK